MRIFWNDVLSLISNVMGVLTKSTPYLALLNIQVSIDPPQSRTIVSRVLIASHLVINKKWKTILAPDISE